MNRRPAPRPVCPLCGHDDGLAESARPGPGLRLFVCANHSPAYQFTSPAWEDLGGEGVYAEYGLDESLVRCVQAGAGHTPGDGFVEHAIVEYRLSLENPDGYRVCLEKWGHTTIKPTEYSASTYIGLRLGALSRQGEVVHRPGPGTGHFAYNTQLGYWTRSGADTGAGLLSWKEFADREGLDPTFPYAKQALGLG